MHRSTLNIWRSCAKEAGRYRFDLVQVTQEKAYTVARATDGRIMSEVDWPHYPGLPDVYYLEPKDIKQIKAGKGSEVHIVDASETHISFRSDKGGFMIPFSIKQDWPRQVVDTKNKMTAGEAVSIHLSRANLVRALQSVGDNNDRRPNTEYFGWEDEVVLNIYGPQPGGNAKCLQIERADGGAEALVMPIQKTDDDGKWNAQAKRAWLVAVFKAAGASAPTTKMLDDLFAEVDDEPEGDIVARVERVEVPVVKDEALVKRLDQAMTALDQAFPHFKKALMTLANATVETAGAKVG